MASNRTRKNKENPHYNFMVSWEPKESYVKRESNFDTPATASKSTTLKKADILAQDSKNKAIKKDIIRSIFLVSFILILELVIYLALNRFKILTVQ